MTTDQLIISTIGGIIIAIIGAIPLVLKWRSSEQSAAAERAAQITEQQWSRLQARIESLEASRDQWEARARDLTTQLAELQRERDILAAENRDHLELIEDFIEHHMAIEMWESTGAEPPRPVASWRIRVKLDAIRRLRETNKNN